MVVIKVVSLIDFAVVGCASVHGGSALMVICECVDVNVSIRIY